ncbi:MAG: diguanylate cyclase [Solirubrobacterales bacterium]
MRGQSDGEGTWLCPTDFDRARMLDMEQRLQGARMVLFGSLFVGFAISVPWVGWWPVALVALQVVIYRLLKPVIERSARPEYTIALIVTTAQLEVGVAVALTGGPDSPALLVFLLGVVGLPVRFGTMRPIAAGVLLTEAAIFASTVGVDPAGFADNPTPTIVTAAACVGLAAFAYALMRAESQMRTESIVDELTGLPNRRGMEASVGNLIGYAQRSETPLALMMCDLDWFKSINDRHGHQRGDTVLVETADAIRRALRPTEQVYRVGGEEFLVVVPGCDVDSAVAVAERVRMAIESAQPGGMPVTASVGLSAGVGPEIDFEELFRAADEALYEAKRAGRNRIAPEAAVAIG